MLLKKTLDIMVEGYDIKYNKTYCILLSPSKIINLSSSLLHNVHSINKSWVIKAI